MSLPEVECRGFKVCLNGRNSFLSSNVCPSVITVMLNLLSHVRIVLVEPTHPGNIGAVARSMKTMGLRRLMMVNPKKFPDDEASKRAAGAESVLDDALVVSDIHQALEGCTLVLGTSVRDREVSWPTFDPRVSADKAIQHIQSNDLDGIDTEAVDLCHSQIRIPANDEYSSLNLASAVQIIAYELRMKELTLVSDEVPQKSESKPRQDGQQLATVEQQQGYINHLQEILESVDFIKTKPPTMLMRKLTRLYNKSSLTVEEIQILRGILSAIDNKLN